MGTIAVASLLTDAGVLLQDANHVRWSRTELVSFLNDGQREVAVHKPNAVTQHTVVQLAAGTKQQLPVGSLVLVDVLRNMGADGTKPGRVVSRTFQRVLDDVDPEWHRHQTAAEALHYTYDPQDPKIFYVYPPQPANGRGYVELVHGVLPAVVTDQSSIALDDEYRVALLNYMLFRAWSKDAEYANKELAASYYAQFLAQVLGKAALESGTKNG